MTTHDRSPRNRKRAPRLPFDGLSKSLSDLYTIREATLSAIRDLKRSRNQVADNHAAEIAVLQAGLGQVNRDIERQHNFLSAPKINEEEGTTRSFLCRRPQESAAEYHFLVDKPVTENRIEYLGFRCPKCDASVARWKQIVPWGQGYRCVVFACHCVTYAVHTQGGRGWIAPVSAGHWAVFCQQSESLSVE